MACLVSRLLTLQICGESTPKLRPSDSGVLATAPAATRSAAMVPVMMGFLMTGSNFGQVTGPIAVGAVVSAWGWSAACVMVVAAAILAGLAAWMLARGDHNGVGEGPGLTPRAPGAKE
ncbi:MFS family permease [Bradyrhizobium sp. JR6.1]